MNEFHHRVPLIADMVVFQDERIRETTVHAGRFAEPLIDPPQVAVDEAFPVQRLAAIGIEALPTATVSRAPTMAVRTHDLTPLDLGLQDLGADRLG